MRIVNCEMNEPKFGSRSEDPEIALKFPARQNCKMNQELQIRTKQFALSIIGLVAKLPKTKAADVIGYQLLRSGTSIGANYREAARALSHDDFIHKIGICEKEAAETEYWLELLVESRIIDADSHKHIRTEVGELVAILVASGRTAKSRR